MTAFHTIAIPHDDILQGCLTMRMYWRVSQASPLPCYTY
jgi:hypothetical protein